MVISPPSAPECSFSLGNTVPASFRITCCFSTVILSCSRICLISFNAKFRTAAASSLSCRLLPPVFPVAFLLPFGAPFIFVQTQLLIIAISVVNPMPCSPVLFVDCLFIFRVYFLFAYWADSHIPCFGKVLSIAFDSSKYLSALAKVFGLS